MKIRVEHEDGTIEVITFKGLLTVSEGNILNRIRTDGGMEYFFTKNGFYDGWGGTIEDSRRADEIIPEVESRREHEGSDPPPFSH